MNAKAIRITAVIVTVLCFITVGAAVALCAVFPNKYADKINAAADEFGLDRSLVRSVVWAESGFDPDATSGKGARGLMQLMPETFRSCAAALRIENAENKMYDPESSLRCGCYYLSLLRDKFDGDITAALMAYNAGETNARKFLNGGKIFPETEKYLKKIKFARKVYGTFVK